MGKAAGKPVYELLGGKVWDNVRLYSHIGGGSQIIRMNVDDGAIALWTTLVPSRNERKISYPAASPA